MAKADLGQKRTCQSCNAKFYDLNRPQIVCPKCGTAFDPEALLKARRSRLTAMRPGGADEAEPDEAEAGAGADDKDEEDEAVMEDTSELGQDADDMDEVVDTGDEAREDR